MAFLPRRRQAKSAVQKLKRRLWREVLAMAAAGEQGEAQSSALPGGVRLAGEGLGRCLRKR